MAWWTDQRLHPKTKSKFVIVFGSTFFIPSVKTVSKPKIDFDTKEYRLLNHKFNYPGNGTWQPIELTFVDMNGLGDKSDTFDTSAFLWQILNNTGYAYPYLDGSSDTSNNPYYNNVVDGKDVFSGGHHISTKISFRDDPNTDVRERSSFRTITTPEKSSTIANSFGKGLNGNIDYESAHYARQKISIYQLSPESQNDQGGDKNPLGAEIVECWHLVNPIVKSIGWGDLSYDSDDLVEYTMSIIYDWAIFDRKKIGEPFVVDSLPYQDFMKNYGLAQTAIDQEIATQQELASIQQAFEDSGLGELGSLGEYRNADVDPNIDIENIENLFIDGNFDADGDGVISDAEKIFTQQNEAEIADILESADNLKDEIESEQSFVENFTENNENIFNIKGMDTSGGDNIFGMDTEFNDKFEEAKEDFLTSDEAFDAGIQESLDSMAPDLPFSQSEIIAAANEDRPIDPGVVDGNYSDASDFPPLLSNQEREKAQEESDMADTILEKADRQGSELNETEIEILKRELLRRGRENAELDPADQDDTLDD